MTRSCSGLGSCTTSLKGPESHWVVLKRVTKNNFVFKRSPGSRVGNGLEKDEMGETRAVPTTRLAKECDGDRDTWDRLQGCRDRVRGPRDRLRWMSVNCL